MREKQAGKEYDDDVDDDDDDKEEEEDDDEEKGIFLFPILFSNQSKRFPQDRNEYSTKTNPCKPLEKDEIELDPSMSVLGERRDSLCNFERIFNSRSKPRYT